MMSARSEIDWPHLLRAVSIRLLGKPSRTERNGETWRYGTHGSLAVHVGGRWRDFEGSVGGGTLDLIKHQLQCDKPAALRWLEAEGLINGHAAHGRGNCSPAPAPQTTPVRQTPVSATGHLGGAILRAAVRADDTPARIYLARRWTWPPRGKGPELPSAVRYVDACDIPEGRRDDSSIYQRLPGAAAGCAVFKLTDPAGEKAPAVSLEAITADGSRLDWCGHKRWRRSYGSTSGLVFEARNDPGGHLWLVEGECDALALTLCGHGGCVRGIAGTAGFRLEAATDPERRPLAIVADGDAPGARAASHLRAELHMTGDRRCAIHYLRGGDVAEDLACWLCERAGIRDDGGPNETAAWQDVLTAVKRGARLIDLDYLEMRKSNE